LSGVSISLHMRTHSGCDIQFSHDIIFWWTHPMLAPHRGSGVQVGHLVVSGNEFSSLPGLRGVLRVDSLDVTWDGITNYSWLSGLLCSRRLSMISNTISSLEGLNQVQAIVDPGSKGPALALANMHVLTVEGVAPLRVFAACTPANTSPWSTSVRGDFRCHPTVSPSPASA
jgi:hypothetical protein